GVESALDGLVLCAGPSDPRIDQIASLPLRLRDTRGRGGGGAARSGQGRGDDEQSAVLQLSPPTRRCVAAKAAFGSAASTQCTFRSARSQVTCRLAYARVRLRVSAMACSGVIRFARTATASR